MLAETDLLGECLKDLCAVHARIFQDLALVAQEGKTDLLKRLHIAEDDRGFYRLRAEQAETETTGLLGAALDAYGADGADGADGKYSSRQHFFARRARGDAERLPALRGLYMSGNRDGKRENMFFRRLARRGRREETRSMSDFRLPAAPKVRTIKVAGIVRRRCDLGPGSGPIWGRGFKHSRG